MDWHRVPAITVEFAIATIAVLSLAVAVGLRSLTAGRVEITVNDMIVVAITVTLALLLTGRLAKVAVGTSGVPIETAREAILFSAAKSIAAQVKPLPVAPVEQDTKGGMSEIPGMVRARIQGLDFRLGSGGYVAAATRSYLETLRGNKGTTG